jgi:hypothetical protein
VPESSKEAIQARRGLSAALGGGLKGSEPKSNAGRRTLTMPGTLTTELRAHRKLQTAERLASEYRGSRAPRLNDLRPSAATMMLASELDLRAAGQLLGHSQVALTARYSHVLADRRSVAGARIKQTMFGSELGKTCVHAVRPIATQTAYQVPAGRRGRRKHPGQKSPRSDSNRRPDAYKAPALAN